MNLKIKHFISYLFIALFSINAYGQTNRPLENYPSPNAASLGLYGNIQTSLYTGTPNISVPVYDIKAGSINLPIYLSYNTAAVKPNQQPSWVGLGWDLTTGGCITRSVRLIYDEKMDRDENQRGYYYKCHEMQSIDNLQKLKDKTVFNGDDYYELVPDEFSFSFGPYSGKFYLDGNKKWVVVSDDNIKVEFNESTGFINLSQLRSNINTSSYINRYYNDRYFNEFTLVTPDGCRYTFGGVNKTEYSIDYYHRNHADLIPTTWYLSKAVSPEGYTVSYEYTPGDPVCEIKRVPTYNEAYIPNPSKNFRDKFFEGSGGTYYMSNNTLAKSLKGYLIFPVYLSKITAPSVTIEFNSSQRYDLRPNKTFLYWIMSLERIYDPYFLREKGEPAHQFTVFLGANSIIDPIENRLKWRKLDSIRIVSANLNKTFKLYYTTSGKERLKLNKIVEASSAGERKYGYEFSYNRNYMLPGYCYSDEDHWGYNNGEVIVSEPVLVFEESYYKDRRSPSSIYIQAEVLNQIKYPTGGKTMFEWEINESKYAVSESLNNLVNFSDASGLRIKTIKNYDSDNKYVSGKKYFYTKKKEPSTDSVSGIVKYIPRYRQGFSSPLIKYYIYSSGGFGVKTTNTDSFIGYSQVIEQNIDERETGFGYTCYSYSSHDADIWGEHHRDEKCIESNLTGDSYYIPVSSKAMERGKLMREEHYTADKKLVKDIKYKYKRTSDDYMMTAHQEEINMIEYVFMFYALFKTYTYSYLPEKIIETYYDPQTGQALQQTEQTLTYNQDKMLKSKTIKTSEGRTATERYLYTGDLANHSKDTYYSYYSKNLLNKPIMHEKWSGSDKIITSDVYLYRDDQPVEKYSLNSTDRTQPVYYNLSTTAFDSRLKLTETYKYDAYNNIIEVSSKGMSTVYLWSYKGMYPVAEIKNATYEEVKQALGVNPETLSGANEPDLKQLGRLRSSVVLPYALVTTYTFKPLVGMASMTDPMGITTYYDYDSFGRLKESYTIKKTGEKEIIQSYEYHYSK